MKEEAYRLVSFEYAITTNNISWLLFARSTTSLPLRGTQTEGRRLIYKLSYPIGRRNSTKVVQFSRPTRMSWVNGKDLQELPGRDLWKDPVYASLMWVRTIASPEN